MVSKFNSFINHYEIVGKTLRQVIGKNQNLNYMISRFLDRKNWNGPRMVEPRTWTPAMRASARNILAEASQITFAETEADDPLFTTNDYSYDAVGSLTEKHSYSDTDPAGETVQYGNNEDSRLANVTNSNTTALLGNYVYDHLGQRVLKTDLGATVFIYDIFGNLIAEYNSDGTLKKDYVYLGGRRLAMIKGVSIGPFPGCGWQPPSQGGFCGISALGQDVAFNWILIVAGPLLIGLGLKYRKNKKAVACIIIAGAGIIAIMIATKASSQPPNPNSEFLYFYHNDHLGTPKVMTDSTGAVVWDAVYKPFGEINTLATEEITNNFRFPGQYEDDLTGMYYNHHRYYMPELGRYNRVDPIIRLVPYSYDYYYANNNSIIFTDINGLYNDQIWSRCRNGEFLSCLDDVDINETNCTRIDCKEFRKWEWPGLRGIFFLAIPVYLHCIRCTMSCRVCECPCLLAALPSISENPLEHCICRREQREIERCQYGPCTSNLITPQSATRP